MSKVSTLLCAALVTFTVAGCQANDDGTGSNLEVIDVSQQLTVGASYHIDLHRDAIFYVAPNLDTSRLTVTCPTGPTFSFTDYVDIRILPTAPAYDPATGQLVLTNGTLPQDSMRSTIQALAAGQPDLLCECTDDDNGKEKCTGCDWPTDS